LESYAAGWIGEGRKRYWIGNLSVERDGFGARGSCYLAILDVKESPHGAEIQLTGIYTDSLRRQDGNWKFASRQIARDM
jgi:SnoaL-like domain